MRGTGASPTDILKVVEVNPTDCRFVPLAERCQWSVLDEATVARLMVGKYKNHTAGVPLLKDALSLHSYELLLHDLRPKTVIDLGTALGGSSLWFSRKVPSDASIVTIDIDDFRTPACREATNVHFAQLDISDATAMQRTLTALPHPWLVSEDCHVDASVLMAVLDPLMEVGDYVVFEDTHPSNPDRAGMSAESIEPYSTMSGWASEKLRSVERAMLARPHYLIDAKIQDFYGYNGCTHINSVFCKKSEPAVP